MMNITYLGGMHVYFNAHAAAPLVWCISDLGATWELAVRCITMRDATMQSEYWPEIKRTPDHAGPPSAYFICRGKLTVIEGEAVIEGCE